MEKKGKSVNPPETSDRKRITMLKNALKESEERITERNENEEILRESETRFRTLVESAPMGIIITDRNEKTIFANRKFSEMFGYTVEDIRSEEEWWPRAYPDPGYREVMKRKWSQTMSKTSIGNTAATQLESKVTCRDGSIKYVVIDAVTPGDLNIVTFVDVTRRKEAEDELRKLKEELEIKVEEKTAELIERVAELERFHEATIEREIRMKELIEENKRLKSMPDKNNV
ncbi:MAG: PAS domain S-box protein [Bacteroidales bacterium]